MKTLNVDIAGAGIGGLTLANALEQQGHNVCLYEKRPIFKFEGAGILIARNALSLLDRIDIGSHIRKASNKINALEIRLAGDKPLRRAKALDTVAIHRERLHSLLLDHLYHSSPQPPEYTVFMGVEQLPESDADLRVGADGIYSKVRQRIAPDAKINDSGQLCWRGVIPTDFHTPESDVVVEYWDAGRRVGIVPLGEHGTYVYLVLTATPDTPTTWVSHDALCAAFADISPIASDAVAALDHQSLRCDRLKEVRSPRWFSGNTVLLGDAAHAMTPNMGQGACQAIEDAVTLAASLQDRPSVKQALRYYFDIRRRRVDYIQTQSWRIGTMAHYESPLKRFCRNVAFYLTPKKVDDMMMQRILEVPYFD